jgi:6-phosphogluconolactonase
MIHVYPDIDTLSRAAAELFFQTAHRAVEKSGRFTVALSGGHSPQKMYEFLAGTPYRNQVPWDNTFVFWGDERCVPKNDPRSNARMAFNALLKFVPVPSQHIHRMICALTPEETMDHYDTILKHNFAGELPRFDLILLGLGTDGHTASLFPESAILEEKKRWVVEVRRPGEDIRRISLTLPVINNAEKIVFLVFGEEKAEILSQVLEGPYQPQKLPAQLVQPFNNDINWLVDEAAATKIRGNYNEAS